MKKKLHKQLKMSHKKAQKKLKFFTRHPFIIPVTTFFVVVFVGLMSFVALGATTVGANDKRIVDVFVDGEGRTVTTRAKTVGDLLERLEVPLIQEDTVEPTLDTVILEDNTQVNVFRARPVEVIDEGRILTILTAQRAPRLLAEEAGLSLFDEDNVYLQGPDGSRLSSSFGERLIIERSKLVQLNIYGVVGSQRTAAKTVGEFLQENNITVEEGATVQPTDLGSAIEDGMLLAVNKIGITTESVVEPIPFDTETREDASLSIGESQVQREGVDGERTVIYEITEKDGEEVERKELQSITNIEPVTKIVMQGKKPVTLSATINVSAEKEALMAAAGIAPSDYPYVDYIINRESTWRPGAVNSSSGAYGLCQSLPASKMASAGADYLTNPVTQLRWCAGYAQGRYGGWQNAYNAWLVQHWW